MTTKQRANAPTLLPDNAAAEVGPNGRTLARGEEAAFAQSTGRSSKPAPERSRAERHSVTADVQSQRPPARTVERHSHDIFQDQVRWMNRLKLDLDERYGAKVTGNAMVQLALDLFRDDFVSRGEKSSLFRVLVQGYPADLASQRHDENGRQAGEENGS
ncbi:MAG: hypothetical protein IH609_11740 [Dehalococcoidia bacterium]|nr:hypothetical protein [Dehalococcoidia bacterium]